MLGSRFESEIREQPDVWRRIARSDASMRFAGAVRGIERADIDATFVHGIEHVARRHQLGRHLRVKSPPSRTAVREQVMAERIEPRL